MASLRLGRYQRAWLRWDLLAGVTTAAVVIPQAVAYASLAGLPVQVGLYVAIVPMVAYALIGTSRPLSVSSTSTISILTAGALVDAGAAGDATRAVAAASLLALLVGGILAAGGLLRLGFLADFISSPVLAGFKAGMGLVIAASQLGKVLGVPVEGDGFFAKVWSALGQLGDANPATVALALGGLAVLLTLRRWAPRVPGPLVVVVLGIALVGLTDLESRGVALVGPVSGGLPKFELPELAGVGALLPAAVGIALMSFIESISAARAFAAKDDPPVDADRELLALGAANLAGGLFQAYPAGGGTSQTAVNDGAGARTQLAEVVTAVVAVLTLTLLAGLLADLAQAILGAIVLVAAIGLVNLAPLRRMRTIRRRDFWLGLVALAGVLIFGVLPGVLVAVLISLLVLLHELDHPRVVASERAPGLLVVRPRDDCSSPTPVACSTTSPPSPPTTGRHRGWCLSTSAPSTTSRSPPWNGWPTRPRSCIVRAAPCGRPRRANGRRRCSAAPASCSAAPTCRPTPDASASGSSRASRRQSPPTSSRPCRTTR